MNSPTRHTWLRGGRAVDRAAELERAGAADIAVNCHRSLRGPYSGTCVVLKSIAGPASTAWPDLVDDHRTCILYAAPALSEVIGPALPILTFSTPHDERTRFFGLGYVRSVSHGIVTFLTSYAERLLASLEGNGRSAGKAADDLLRQRARRRSNRAGVPGVAAPPGGAANAASRRRHCRRDPARWPGRSAGQLHPKRRGGDLGAGPCAASDEDLAREYVWSDGASDDPQLDAAYQRAEPSLRALLHDQRATELEATGDWDLRLGALPYHRERGQDRPGRLPGAASRARTLPGHGLLRLALRLWHARPGRR